MLCGEYRVELLKEVKVNDEIMYIAEGIKSKSGDVRLNEMRADLEKTRYYNV